MRIAEIVNNLEIGGLERLVVDLTLNLMARGHRTHVICLRGSGPLGDLLKRSGVEVLALEKSDGFSFRILRRLCQYLRERNVDVVHTHNPLVHHYGALAGRLVGAPVVVNTRHGLGNFPRSGRAERNSERIFRLSCCMTDRVVTVCPAARDFFQGHAGLSRAKLAVIHNGIDLDRFPAVQPRPGHCQFVFGTVGRLVPVKDHRSLLEAFSLVSKGNPRVRLEILGDGPLREQLKQAAVDLGIAQAVRFHGFSLDVPSFLARLDAFVLSSLSEGLPLTLLEAMAAALPVISTAVGGVPQLVEETSSGWLCRPSQPKELADLMIHALRSEDRIDMGMRARAQVAHRYSLAKMTEQYELLFERLLHAPKRSNDTPPLA